MIIVNPLRRYSQAAPATGDRAFTEESPGTNGLDEACFYLGISVVSFSWELSQYLLQVIHTRRSVFAPPQGSAAVEVNPSEALLDVIEQSRPRSLMQYLAYLDLCMVTESNVDLWRRAIFFEETDETYMRVMTLCLRPLKKFTSSLAESLERSLVDKSERFAQQLNSTMDANMDLRLHEAFNDFQGMVRNLTNCPNLSLLMRPDN